MATNARIEVVAARIEVMTSYTRIQVAMATYTRIEIATTVYVSIQAASAREYPLV
jgi:hypothetical protein